MKYNAHWVVHDMPKHYYTVRILMYQDKYIHVYRRKQKCVRN